MRTGWMLVTLLFVLLNTSPLAAQEQGPPTGAVFEKTEGIQTLQMSQFLGESTDKKDRALMLSGEQQATDPLTLRYRAQYKQARNMIAGGTVATILGLGFGAIMLGITLSGDGPCEDGSGCVTDQFYIDTGELILGIFMWSTAAAFFITGVVLIATGSVRKARALRVLKWDF